MYFRYYILWYVEPDGEPKAIRSSILLLLKQTPFNMTENFNLETSH